MIIYLSHNYGAKDYLNQEIVPCLIEAGHRVNSSWLDVDDRNRDKTDQQYADQDLYDIMNCDVFIHFCDQVGETPGKGKFIEFGVAHCRNKRILVVGVDCSKSVFFFLKKVERFTSFGDAFLALGTKSGN